MPLILSIPVRKFQLDRLLMNALPKQDYATTVFGKAFGAGVAEYMISQDSDKAIFTLYKNYYPVLEDNKRTESLYCSPPSFYPKAG